MTREEAIDELSVVYERLSHPEDCENGCYSFRDGDYLEAIDMAIEALEAQPNLQPTCNQLATDTISRQATIMHFVKASKRYEYGMFDLEELTHELWQVPSARPTGEWIVEHDGNGWNDWENFTCPVCGEKFEKVVNRRKHKFCSNCGAKMEVEHELV